MEALNGIDLYGSRGGSSSVIHALPDDILQCKVGLPTSGQYTVTVLTVKIRSDGLVQQQLYITYS